MIDLLTLPWTEIVSTALVLIAIWIKHRLDTKRDVTSLDREWALERLKKAYDKRLEALEEIRDQLPVLRMAIFGPLNEMGALFQETRREEYNNAMDGVLTHEKFLLKVKPYLSSCLQKKSGDLIQVIMEGQRKCQTSWSFAGKEPDKCYKQWEEGYGLLTSDALRIIDQLDEDCIQEIGEMIKTGK